MSRTACYNLLCLREGMINTKLMGSNPIIKFTLNETNVQKKNWFRDQNQRFVIFI